MNIKKLFLLALSLSLLSPAAAPAAAAGPAAGSRTELLSESSAPLTEEEARAFFTGPGKGDRVIVIPAILIIMAGAKAWSVITDNRPTADLDSAYASAIPGFNFNWEDLKDWRKVTRKYRFTIDNKLQGRAVDILYEVTFFHGAIPAPEAPHLKGKYIANFTIKPLDIKLKWGWKVALEVSMSDPMNTGTSDEPVAWLNADLKWRYAKPLSTEPEIGLNSLSIDGLGNMTEISYREGLDIPPVRTERPEPGAPPVKWD